ncbi:MAG TPA: YggS family pyridoxal phosphate-dependent enzyme [Bacteroidales bacterium]|nr:YggS family pyridoxal phosphate-dependent enzyme [Bacteroidales bacterium]
MSIKEHLYEVVKKIPSHVTLVAVSKTKPVTDIMEVYDEGVRDFGENKVQELVQKYEQLPKDIRWHLIGHLQTNKVKYVAPFVYCIQSVDSLKLLKEINKEALKNNRIINCLLQVHIAKEETKFGFSCEELTACLENDEFKSLKNVSIGGLMGMATFTSDQSLIQNEFTELKSIFDKLKLEYFKSNTDFKNISMGMSSDYELAINCGSTIVRVGSLIFGERQYNQ